MTLDQLATEHVAEALWIIDKILFALSLGSCLLVLALTGWIYSVKAARPHLRRVSFRLMLWALMLMVPYSVFKVFLLADTPITRSAMDNPLGCAVMSTIFFQTLFTVNCLITCIALNLYLITCWGVNPLQLRLERWYIAGSLFFGLGLPIIPAVLGHLGKDPLYGICYLSVEDEVLRLKVVIVELVMWQLLFCIVASLAVGAAIIKLVKQSRATKRAMRSSMQLNDHPLDLDVEAAAPDAADKHIGGLAVPTLSPILGSPNPLLGDSDPKCELKHSQTASAERSDSPRRWKRWNILARFSSTNHNGQLHEQVLGIALRISLYPIALIVINIVQSITDIYFAYTINDRNEHAGRVILYVFYRITYGGRGIVLALGLKIAWRETFNPNGERSEEESSDFAPLEGERDHSPDEHDKDQGPMSLADFMNAGVLNKAYAVPETRRTSSQSIDMVAALRRLPFHPANLHPFDTMRNSSNGGRRGRMDEGTRSAPMRGWDEEDARSILRSGSGSGSESYTRSFAGVATASLPSTMTDDVDVDLRLTYSPSRSRYSAHPLGQDADAQDSGDIADQGQSTADHARYGEADDAIILHPIHATPRPSLVSVPDTRKLAVKLDKLVQVDETAGPSRARGQTADGLTRVMTRQKEKEAREEPRKVSWGSIPTAPMPPRMLQRHKRLAAAQAAAEIRAKEEAELEKRRLAELETQL